MQLHQMRYVLALAGQENFSKAAKALFITQPTLSQQMLALEEELGVKLFIRQPRRVTLTDAGGEFVLYARRIVNEADALAQVMAGYATQLRGRVRVGVLWVFGYIGIAEIIHDFQRENPTLETPITVDGSKVLLQKLNDREMDAVFVIATAKDLSDNPQVQFCKIRESDMVVILPISHPLARREQLTYADLDGQNVIIPARDSSLYLPIITNLQAAGVTPNVVCESGQSDVIVQCVTGGLGCAFISRSIALANLNDRIVLRPIFPTVRREVYFAVLEDTLVIPGVRSMWDYINTNHHSGCR